MDPFAPHMRTTDADRNDAVEALKHNFQLGRLDVEELSNRIGIALNARTFGELDEAMFDLPPIPRWTQPPPMPPMPYLPYAPYLSSPPRSDALANAALVLGIFSVCCGFTAPVGLALGLIALHEERRYPDARTATAISAVSVNAVFGLVWLTVWIISAF